MGNTGGAILIVDDKKGYQVEDSRKDEALDTNVFSFGISDEAAGYGIGQAV
jgi:hypothetical protein